jgi:protein-disulfide isomerase
MINPQIRLRVPVSKSDHRRGPEEAPLVLVEYGDYECPYCGEAHPIVKHIENALRGELLLVFRNFPLTQIHPHAMNAARAAEAAGLQRKFWEMHDTLYENQENLDPESLLAYAAQLDLDLDRFAQDMLSRRVEDRILLDFEGGARSGVNGTPTFFVNGFRFDGNYHTLPDELQELREALPH